MSNFAFLETDFPLLFAEASKAEAQTLADARVTCLYARRVLEGMVKWLYANDSSFGRVLDSSLNGLMGTTAFETHVPQAVRLLAHAVRRLGNAGAHDARVLTTAEALAVLRDLFAVLQWFASVYGSGRLIVLDFNESLIPEAPLNVVLKSRAEILVLETQLLEQTKLLEQKAEQFSAELEALRAEVVARKASNSAFVAMPRFSEKTTRERLIDGLLREAGWDVTAPNVREFRNSAGIADYVLWGQDGLPLAVIEAKRTSLDARAGQQQAMLYALALEQQFGRLPVVFYSNGVQTYLWDSARGYPPRLVQGFYNADSLELLVQRRRSATDLSLFEVNKDMAGRYYQLEAISLFSQRLMAKQRKGLLVMATGTGKTRVAVALTELLMRAGWVRRVLFLADRNGLVRQAKKAFVKHYPSVNCLNLVEDKNIAGARVVFSTYQTMMQQLESGAFTVGHFDLVIIDEAHRSVYSKFGAIFAFFDSMLLGLTATPRDEVDRNTYKLFDMFDSLPVFEYGLDQAVRDGFLVPPVTKSVHAQFLREGIVYDQLSSFEQAEFDEIDWDEFGGRREEIRNTELYKWLFNENTVDQVLQTLFEHGQKVAGGDLIGKTIIFAQSVEHAKFIQQRFDLHYPHLAGSYAQVIAHNIERSDQILEQFIETAMPRIAISVDMLDTGIDVPEILNLVFFKRVLSKTKFWQMLGRGTRLCEQIFGFEQHKTGFLVLDFCGNLEFFNLHPKGIEGQSSEPLSVRLFKSRVDILEALSGLRDQVAVAVLYKSHADFLHEHLCAIPQNNFMVRGHLELIDRFCVRENWDSLGKLQAFDLKKTISGLPCAIVDNDENAKRFDALIFQATLGLLEQKPRQGVQARIVALCEQLERKQSIVAVQQQLALIRAAQTTVFWQESGASDLEQLRLALRHLIGLIDHHQRQKHLETNFEDSFAAPTDLALASLEVGVDREAYKKKVRAFIEANLEHSSIKKLRTAQTLLPHDLKQLEELLFTARALESRQVFEWAYGQEANLGVFIRTLVGLDRVAAKTAFGKYLDGKTFSSDQIQFVNFIIDALTANGLMDQKALFEAPFTDLHSQSIQGLFALEETQDILGRLTQINLTSRFGDDSLQA